MLAVARAMLRARWCAYTGNNERKGIPFRTGGDETKKGLCSPYMPFARTYSSTNRKNVIRFLLCVVCTVLADTYLCSYRRMCQTREFMKAGVKNESWCEG